MKVKAIKTSVFKEGGNLTHFIIKHIKRPAEGSVLAVTSKIVALSERRTLPLPKTEKERIKIIKAESQWAMPTKYVWLTKKDGMIMASAGIDESNGNGKLILLPKNSYKAAAKLQKSLKKHYGLKKFGVLITDSRTQPLRAGIIGSALGYAGFKGIKSYKNKKDLFGRKFKFSTTNIADCLATAAVLTMGEGDEQQPLAIIEHAPIEFSSRFYPKETFIELSDDIYLPLLKNIYK